MTTGKNLFHLPPCRARGHIRPACPRGPADRHRDPWNAGSVDFIGMLSFGTAPSLLRTVRVGPCPRAQFVRQACEIKGADLRPDFNWQKKAEQQNSQRASPVGGSSCVARE